MNKSNLLSPSKYSKLLADIRKLITEGRARVEAAARNELVLAYWQIGKRIDQEGLTENANYGDSVLEDLAEELNIDRSTLSRSVAFFNTYKNSPPQSNHLSWSHYRELLSIKDDSLRAKLELQAEQGAWSKERLANFIQTNSTEVISGSTQRSKKLARPTEPTYVYKAVVDKVVDGDTLVLRIDLGFLVWKEQRVRLALIDCPAIDEPNGQKAFQFVRDLMAKTSFVMVKTHQIDIYGRYVAHVFYSLNNNDSKDSVFKSGKYLNQELINKGFASLL